MGRGAGLGTSLAVRARLAANSSSRPPTELEVRFTRQGEGTLVELEHRGWEGLGEIAEEARASYGTGWIPTLARFQEAADKEVA